MGMYPGVLTLKGELNYVPAESLEAAAATAEIEVGTKAEITEQSSLKTMRLSHSGRT